MSKLILLTVFLSFGVFADGGDHEEKEPVVIEVIDGASVYGEKWTSNAEKVAIDVALSAKVKGEDSAKIYTGRVTKVCQNSGCWMMLESKGHFAKVDFNDHSFFIPKDTSGSAEVYGVLKTKVLSEDHKKHLEDEGAGKMPEQTYEIVATSVKIGA